jgi:probable rRNA maturation factor
MKKLQTTIINDIDREYIDQEKLMDFIGFLFTAMDVDKELEFNILFSNDEKIRSLNNQFRGKNEFTNILSFYGYDGDIFGDIIISVDTVEREAQEKGEDVFLYTLFLIAHGFLHLLGYTHETMEKYTYMIDKQNQLIKEWTDERRN